MFLLFVKILFFRFELWSFSRVAASVHFLYHNIMPRTKPTLKLGVYGSFDINPEQAVTSYFESKLQDELY